MKHWHDQIDDHLDARERERLRREKERQRKRDFLPNLVAGFFQGLSADSQARKGQKLAAIRCHVPGCTVTGTPGEKLAGYVYEPGIGWDHQTGTHKPRYKPDYHAPGNLRRCTRCGQWTCQSHLHRGICATCAARL